MIRLRVDVDYPFSSRLKSVGYLLVGWPSSGCYLGNARVIAGLVNSAVVDVVVYWFFNVRVLPDIELLSLTNNSKHVWGLHVLNDAASERTVLEKHLGRKVEFFTVHGTESLVGQFIWGRKRGVKRVVVPEDLGLKAFDVEPAHSLDVSCFRFAPYIAALSAVSCNAVISFHPEWLYKGNGVNRGGYVDALKWILGYNQ